MQIADLFVRDVIKITKNVRLSNARVQYADTIARSTMLLDIAVPFEYCVGTLRES